MSTWTMPDFSIVSKRLGYALRYCEFAYLYSLYSLGGKTFTPQSLVDIFCKGFKEIVELNRFSQEVESDLKRAMPIWVNVIIEDREFAQVCLQLLAENGFWCPDDEDDEEDPF